MLACNLISGLILEILDTELGTLPEFDLILKMDQKRLGLILKELPKYYLIHEKECSIERVLLNVVGLQVS